MNGKQEEVFRGHWEECLRHYGAVIRSKVKKFSKGSSRSRAPIVNFCGVTDYTVTRWLYKGESLPDGEALIKLMCFLNMVGYRVIELERMPQTKRRIVELIGFGVLAPKKVNELLGFSESTHVFQVLHGSRGLSKEKEKRMWDIWKERKEKLEEKMSQSQELLHQDVPRGIQIEKKKTETGKPTTPPSRQAIVSIMEGLLELLEERPLDKLPESDLVELQRSAPVVLRLSAQLSALSSRLIMREQQKGAER